MLLNFLFYQDIFPLDSLVLIPLSVANSVLLSLSIFLKIKSEEPNVSTDLNTDQAEIQTTKRSVFNSALTNLKNISRKRKIDDLNLTSEGNAPVPTPSKQSLGTIEDSTEVNPSTTVKSTKRNFLTSTFSRKHVELPKPVSSEIDTTGPSQANEGLNQSKQKCKRFFKRNKEESNTTNKEINTTESTQESGCPTTSKKQCKPSQSSKKKKKKKEQQDVSTNTSKEIIITESTLEIERHINPTKQHKPARFFRKRKGEVTSDERNTAGPSHAAERSHKHVRFSISNVFKKKKSEEPTDESAPPVFDIEDQIKSTQKEQD